MEDWAESRVDCNRAIPLHTTGTNGRNYSGQLGGKVVKAAIAMLATALAACIARADDINWVAAVPLWKSLSPKGQLLDAGPAPGWVTVPAAKLGVPATPQVERPKSLPELLVAEVGPTLPPLPAKPAGEPRVRPKREVFGASRFEAK